MNTTMYPKHACICLNTVESMPKPAWYVVLYIQNRVYNHVLVQSAVLKQLDETLVLNISTGTIAGMQKFETRKRRPLTFGSTYKPLLVKVYELFLLIIFPTSNGRFSGTELFSSRLF